MPAADGRSRPDTLDLDEAVRFALHLADLADDVTLAGFEGRLDVQTKDDGSLVTQADRDAEDALRRAIRERHPDHAVLGEEAGLDGPAGAPTWILDPIDGTNNFTRGIPVFATLIALAVDERPVVGVVSAPALGSRWQARAGGPARHNGDVIRVSDTAELGAAHVSFGGLGYFARKGWEDLVGDLTRSTRRQRGFGDFWQHCLVASGGVDAAIEAEVNRWDLAAVKVVVESAGGRFTSLHGVDTDAGATALSSNGHLHDEILDRARSLRTA